MTEFDVAIIGSGSAGQTVAAACASAGRSVLVIDRLPFGGTCALRGCVPKKLLLAGAEAVSRADGLAGKGIAGGCRIDWPALMERKRTYIADVPGNTLAWMHKMGMTTMAGTARFTSPGTVEIDGETVRATSIVIATGARPVSLGIEGEDLVQTSTEFLALAQMPRKVAFIGGGYISFELARLAQLAGAKATIIHRSRQVLKGFDPGLADMLADRYRSSASKYSPTAPVERVEAWHPKAGSPSSPAKARSRSMRRFMGPVASPTWQTSTSRPVASSTTSRGVAVDESLRSVSNPSVWSAGDAAAIGAPLTPVAGAQGEVVAAGILGTPAVFDGSVTPSVVFSDPPLARVGVDASAAEKDGALEVRTIDMSEWFTQTRWVTRPRAHES